MLDAIVKVIWRASFGNNLQIVDALAYRHSQLMRINDAGKEPPCPLSRDSLGQQVLVS